jgi:hypothetical protein
MPANVDGMVREGISAYRSGRKDEARALLLRAVEIDQYNEDAWLWLSAVVETPEEQRTCLENVMTINPNNERARQGMQILDQKLGGNAKAMSTHADDVLANASFTPPPVTAMPAGPFGGDSEELPATINMGDAPPTASSSASSNYRVNEPSAQEYDDWVTQLNIGGTAPETSTSSSSIEAVAQFMSVSSGIMEDEDTTDVDDLFSSGPFSAPDTGLPQVSKPAESPAKKDAPKSSPLAVPASKPAFTAAQSADNLLDDMDDIRDLALDDDLDDQVADFESAEFFQYIPREIETTRLPGTNESYPFLVVIGLIILVLLNIGALALFIQKLTAS